MNRKDRVRLDNATKTMKILNKMQSQCKKLRSLGNQGYEISELEKKVFENSLSPVDVIGEIVYLDYLKKNGVKPIAEPKPYGWYHVQGRKK